MTNPATTESSSNADIGWENFDKHLVRNSFLGGGALMGGILGFVASLEATLPLLEKIPLAASAGAAALGGFMVIGFALEAPEWRYLRNHPSSNTIRVWKLEGKKHDDMA